MRKMVVLVFRLIFQYCQGIYWIAEWIIKKKNVVCINIKCYNYR